jgi:hypothetical protein
MVAQPEEIPGLPRVLLIGDSLSMGYTEPTRKLLKGRANVHCIPESGESTRLGLVKIDGWLGAENWDVIHFNWGLHDVCYRNPSVEGSYDHDKANGALTSTPEQYAENLRRLVGILKTSGAILIWASTTPVPEGEAGRVKGNEVRYNAIAEKVMKEEGVAINDLHSYVLPRMGNFQVLPGNVHFTEEGSAWLARAVAASILEALNRGALPPQ